MGAFLLAMWGVVIPISSYAAEDPTQFFETRIRPILADHCYSCHGPGKQKSDLRVDGPAALLKGGSRGPAISPGDADASLLMQAVRYQGDLEMPPDEKLPQADIDALAQWVAAGAPWPDYDATAHVEAASPMDTAHTHWAYQPMQPHEPPAVQDSQWPRDLIDQFVLADIERAGLKPSPEAEHATLLRRLSFDLTGLPPTPDMITRFLADESPFAYEKVVDRLLDSPQFGEHWARHWLDIVRYTDSFDARASTVTDPAEIWRYRDWVVNSLNADMPYDQFLQYQVAGDLLPAPNGGFNRDGLIATGVLAIGHWPQGDADKEKMVTDIVDDQVDLVTRAFMGVSMSCARCHDHKFDPFTARDYYGIAGIFFSSSILPGPGAKTEGSPILHLPLASKEELAERAEKEQRINTLRGEIEGMLREERTAFARQESARAGQYLLAAKGAAPADALHPEALQRWQTYLGLRPARLDAITRDVHMPGIHSRSVAPQGPSVTINTTGKHQHYLTIDHPRDALLVHPSPDKPARIAWAPPAVGDYTYTLRVADADKACGDGFAWKLYTRAGEQSTTIAEGRVDNGKAADPVMGSVSVTGVGETVVLDILPHGDYSCDSTVVDWQMQGNDGNSWDLRAEVMAHFENPAGLAWRLEDPNTATPDPVLFAGLADASPEQLPILAQTVQQRVSQAAAAPPDTPEAKAFAVLLGEQGPFWISPVPAAAESPRGKHEAEMAQLTATPLPPMDLAVGIQEGGVPNTEHAGIHNVRIHKRGDYNNLGDEVPRGMPAWLTGGQAPAIGMAESGRRELAAWLVDDANPLTARVAVNRLWQHVFGEGIVRTPGDFGVRGEAPTNQPLLDYLAREFIEGGWRIKPIIRRMVLSSTYRQATIGNNDAIRQDPENRLWARANRKRLTAEQLRDALLAVNGRLDLTPGGPAFPSMDTPRRTLYLRNVRSDRSTYTMLFDAADPTSIIPKRTEATIAPQALFLMNHPFMLAQAERLAQAVAPMAADESQLLAALDLRLYARPHATPREGILASLGGDPQQSLKALCQVMLSANEFVFLD